MKIPIWVTNTIFVLFFVAFFYPSSAFAATIEISNLPSSIEKDQEFEIPVNLTGAAANTINYLRAAFYHESSTTSYFGYTFNHEQSWYNGKPPPIDPHKFLQISINPEGSFSGMLRIRTDIESSHFNGEGAYFLKVGRYTANGDTPSDWSNAVSLIIHAPSPTPSLAPTVKPTSAPAPTNTPKPSSSPNPPTPTPIPTSSASKSSKQAKLGISPKVYGNTNLLSGREGSVLAQEDIKLSPTPNIKLLTEKEKNDLLPIILISLGGMMIIGAALWIGIMTRKQKALDSHP